jgi:hypothetical protein
VTWKSDPDDPTTKTLDGTKFSVKEEPCDFNKWGIHWKYYVLYDGQRYGSWETSRADAMKLAEVYESFRGDMPA